MNYSGVYFDVAALRSEVENIGALSKSFLTPDSVPILSSWASALSAIANRQATDPVVWMISEQRPLRTLKSKGFEPNGRKVKQGVWGELSFTWGVSRVSLNKRKPESALICLNGLASTKMKLYTEDESENGICVAQWQVEIGSHDSPGWHFHIGLCNELERNQIFPKWLTVPRVPGMLVSPTDALDFLLGELFQEDWQKTVSSQNYQNAELGRAQQSRIEGMLNWHKAELSSGSGSAWNRLKRSKPKADVFLK